MVRVVPDVAAIAKAFDYSVPDDMSGDVRVGTMVRVMLGRRRVNAWVVDEVAPGSDAEGVDGVELRPLLAVRGWGPPTRVVELCRWASWRWAGPLSHVLGTASPPKLVRSLPRRPPVHAATVVRPSGAAAELVADAVADGRGTSVVRLAPAHDPFPLVQAAAERLGARRGGVLVLSPARRHAEELWLGLRRLGHQVALLPEQWALARAGDVVAVGTRSAALAPLPDMTAAVVLDAHDQAYQEERAPTWVAWEVVAERARGQGAPCALVSPCPTLDLLGAGRLVVGSRRQERAGWPSVEVVDRRADDPRSGLYSERLVSLVRWAAAENRRRVLCVLNRTGRARLLACATCGEIVRCERCGAAVERVTEGTGESAAAARGQVLACRRCGAERPEVCARCGSSRMRALRVGVTRVREELEALVGTPVSEVSAQSQRDAPGVDDAAAVVVGTEAVLHRYGRADAVAFLDFDAELLAPRLRAGEQALALLARAAAVVGGGAGPGAADAPPPGRPGTERAPGRLLVQTRLPQHPVLAAAVSADPGILARAEHQVRSELGLPPLRAQALVSGEGADAFGRALAVAAAPSIEVRGPLNGVWSVLAPDHSALADLLTSTARPPGRLRIEVDPVRA